MLRWRKRPSQIAATILSVTSRSSTSTASTSPPADDITTDTPQTLDIPHQSTPTGVETSTQVESSDFKDQRSIKSMTLRFKSLLQGLSEELQCVICLEDYAMPRLLNCGHSFCTSCLKSISRGPGTSVVKCPTCRQQTKIPSMKIEDLPLNYPVMQVQDAVREADLTASGMPVLQKCAYHSKEEVKFYCKTCDSLICSECVVSCPYNDEVPLAVSDDGDSSCCKEKQHQKQKAISHQGHDVMTLKHAAIELYNDIKRENEKAKSVLETVKSTLTNLDKHKRELESNYNGIVCHINREFDSIADTIEQRRKQLLEKTREFKQTEQKRIDTSSEQYQKLTSNIESSLKSAEDLVTAKLSSFKQSFNGNRAIRQREILELWQDGPSIKSELQQLSKDLTVQLNHQQSDIHNQHFIDTEFSSTSKVSLVQSIKSFGSTQLTPTPHVTMQVYVKSASGTTEPCQLYAWQDKLADLQGKINEQLKLPVPLQKLFFKGKPLVESGGSATEQSGDDKSSVLLSDHGIEHGSLVHLGFSGL